MEKSSKPKIHEDAIKVSLSENCTLRQACKGKMMNLSPRLFFEEFTEYIHVDPEEFYTTAFSFLDWFANVLYITDRDALFDNVKHYIDQTQRKNCGVFHIFPELIDRTGGSVGRKIRRFNVVVFLDCSYETIQCVQENAGRFPGYTMISLDID